MHLTQSDVNNEHNLDSIMAQLFELQKITESQGNFKAIVRKNTATEEALKLSIQANSENEQQASSLNKYVNLTNEIMKTLTEYQNNVKHADVARRFSTLDKIYELKRQKLKEQIRHNKELERLLNEQITIQQKILEMYEPKRLN